MIINDVLELILIKLYYHKEKFTNFDKNNILKKNNFLKGKILVIQELYYFFFTLR